ncbi:hypothetical protein ACN47E_005730 [Coniothyrium glycines]
MPSSITQPVPHVPSAEGSLTSFSDEESALKKRKFSEASKASATETQTLQHKTPESFDLKEKLVRSYQEINDRDMRILRLEQQIASNTSDELDWKEQLNYMKKKILNIQLQLQDEVELVVSLQRQLSLEKQSAMNSMVKVRNAEKKIVEYQLQEVQRGKQCHNLKEELRKLQAEYEKLENEAQYYHRMAAMGPAPHRSHEPTLVPHFDPSVRDSRDYQYDHPEAPRDNKMYGRFLPALEYRNGAGKVDPSRYGSNGRWDLGLCQVHFSTPYKCDYGEKCEYRHAPLTTRERSYITFLLPNGPSFLRRSDQLLMNKHE